MTAPRIRVLVVDDSAFARKVMRTVLEADPRIDVVGIARDGLDALEKIAELTPDVVTLDLVMPELDGLGVLEALKAQPSPPQVVVVSMSDAESELGVAALVNGAFDVVHKPTALATARLYELGDELLQKVVLAADTARRQRPVSVPTPSTAPGPAPAPSASRPPTSSRLLVIGASTGGPRAVGQVLAALPADFPLPVAVVVHMPPGYTEAFADRLDRECKVHVVEASDGVRLEAGTVLVGRAGLHLQLELDGAGWKAALGVQPILSTHRPSVDVLFESAARVAGAGVIGVVLTGMGADGLEGARAIRAAGGHVIVEDESTCVVYGMPRSVHEAGLASEKVPLERVVAAILRKL